MRTFTISIFRACLARRARLGDATILHAFEACTLVVAIVTIAWWLHILPTKVMYAMWLLAGMLMPIVMRFIVSDETLSPKLGKALPRGTAAGLSAAQRVSFRAEPADLDDQKP